MRAVGAVLLCVVPALVSLWLLQLGDMDHRQCVEFAMDKTARPDTLFPSWGAAINDFSASLLRDLAHPLMWFLMFGPFASFAVIHLLAKKPAVRKANLVAFLVFTTFVLLTLLDSSSHHDCDRKGTDQFLSFLLYAPLGIVTATVVASIYTFTKPTAKRETA